MRRGSRPQLVGFDSPQGMVSNITYNIYKYGAMVELVAYAALIRQRLGFESLLRYILRGGLDVYPAWSHKPNEAS